MIQSADGRFLEALFGQIEVAEDADEGGQDAAVLSTKGPLEGRGALYMAMIGRTSIEPLAASGILAAHLIASSRSLHSNA